MRNTYAAALAVERRRGVLDSLSDDRLDLLIGNRGLRGDGVDGATALDSLEERSRARHCGAGLSRRGGG